MFCWSDHRPPTMAKNTNGSGFRKIDIDKFNEDNYKDDDDVGTNGHADDVGPNESEVTALLNKWVWNFLYYLKINKRFFQ